MVRQDFNSTDWLKSKLEFSDVRKIDNIRNFYLIMNVFEDKFGISKDESPKRKYQPNDWYKKISEILEEDIISCLFDIFVKRYGETGQYKIEDLFLGDSKEDEVKKFLREENDDKESKTFTILHIIRVLRNNIIHGPKGYREIPHHEKLFKEINLFLVSCIEKVSV